VGVILDVTPAVAGDSLVILQVKPEVSTARRSPFFPQIAVDTQKRSAETTIMARNGQTIVIGGLHQKSLTEEITRIPLLGHIPLLGYFFSQRSKEIRKTELMVFITPRIITPQNLQTLRKPPGFQLNPP
jgi:type II secretory pathway component GspD/PulD (secretin)